jgi:hypothetical protein
MGKSRRCAASRSRLSANVEIALIVAVALMAVAGLAFAMAFIAGRAAFA